MISRKTLDEILASLPALLVTRIGVTADDAIHMAEHCFLDIAGDTRNPNHKLIWIYVSNPRDTAILVKYRLGFSHSFTPDLRSVQKLVSAFETKRWQWQEHT